MLLSTMNSSGNSIAPTRPLCILHSDDVELRNRLARALQDRAYICHAPDQHRLDELLGGAEAVLLIIDLRSPDAAELAPRLSRLHPQVVAVALGFPGSDPFIAAQDAGLYRVESLHTDPPLLRAMIDHALERVGWMQETQMLRDELARMQLLQSSNNSSQRGLPGRNAISFQHLVKATHQLDRLDELFEKIVDGVAGSALVSRVGLFYRHAGEPSFRLQAGRCCLEDTHSLEFSDRDPLVRWLQRNPRLITRASLDHIADPSERALLRRSLDLLGAETFIPLNLRGRVLGWLFTGQTDGLPFSHNDHPDLSFLSEHIVHALENTIRHHELLRQKDLGENLLQMMQTAIITVDAEGYVVWSNAPAEKLFPTLARTLARASGASPNKLPPRIPAEDLGARLAGLVRDALAGEPTREPRTWESQAAGGRLLAARTRQMLIGGRCVGAVALVDDITDQLMLDAQQEQLERAAFWRDLAAGMSHEIHNPLVAIKTFTQLLPQRHANEEFRRDFTEVMGREVGRLETIVAQIQNFAHPPAPSTPASIHLPDLLEASAKAACKLLDAPDAQIKIQADSPLPHLQGDAQALGQGFQSLFINGIEAAARKQVRPLIRVRVIAHQAGESVTGLKMSITDNGDGISHDLRSKVFSPFYTTKAQGMGLGLPIAQRVILDHGGRIELDPGDLGLCVNILLPLKPPATPALPPLPPGSMSAGHLPAGGAAAAGRLAAGALGEDGRRLSYESSGRLTR
jgi:nitrogen-specific signal transduction histidine kinase